MARCSVPSWRTGARLNYRAQSRNGRGFKEFSEREIDTIGGPDLCDDLHRQQRVPAQLREIVVNANPVESEDAPPYSSHDCLDTIGRPATFLGSVRLPRRCLSFRRYR